MECSRRRWPISVLVMASFIAIRRKTYYARIEAATQKHAYGIAELLPGRDWKVEDDRVVGVIGSDGAHQRLILDDEDESHDPSCLACVAMSRRAFKA